MFLVSKSVKSDNRIQYPYHISSIAPPSSKRYFVRSLKIKYNIFIKVMQKIFANGKCSFQQYSQYCKCLADKLNQLGSYEAEYKKSTNPLLRQHDGEYLQVTIKVKMEDQIYLIKVNIMYSLAYSIPIFLFMIYDLQTSQPLARQLVHSKFIVKKEDKQEQQSDKLRPQNETGIYLTQNMISKQYFYTLHSCQLDLPINLLVPFYFNLINLHPQI